VIPALSSIEQQQHSDFSCGARLSRCSLFARAAAVVEPSSNSQILMRSTAGVCMCVLTSDIFRTHLFAFFKCISVERRIFYQWPLLLLACNFLLCVRVYTSRPAKDMISIIEFLSNSDCNYYPTHKALLRTQNRHRNVLRQTEKYLC
jgi:hypothetical protein